MPAGGGSRMSREAHVRFDGSGKGKLLPATLLERSVMTSKPGGVETLGQRSTAVGTPSVREQPACGPSGVRCIGGVSSSQAHIGNRRTCRLDTGSQEEGQMSVLLRLPRGRTPSGDNHKGESTDARHRDGPTRSSGEGLVMRLERRGWAGQVVKLPT